MAMKTWLLLFALLVLMIRLKTTISQSIIKTLPGYPGELPFKLETGYISVGQKDEAIELFYYFMESEGDPKRDPLIFWLTGGPGCSGFSTLVYEFGPLVFDGVYLVESLPSFKLNQYSWTKIASIIFIDAPAGTGFSYAHTPQGYASSDTKSAKGYYTFLRKWLSIHPEFVKNRFYVGGDSYGGKFAPMVAVEIAKGNDEAGLEPRILLQGYIVGNPRNVKVEEQNARIVYAHRMGLISDGYFELLKSSCLGEYVNPDPHNVECARALDLYNECIQQINGGHILEPKCELSFPLKPPNDYSRRLSLLENHDRPFHNFDDQPLCRDFNYFSSQWWARNETVQEAIHIRKGTISGWERCNDSIVHDQDVESVLKHHQFLSDKGFRALAYSGDHDLFIPYVSTLKWIREMNLTVDEDWRPWTVDGQVAGYTERYKNHLAYLTFATVKGAGHAAPEFKPKQCLAMLQRWLSSYPL